MSGQEEALIKNLEVIKNKMLNRLNISKYKNTDFDLTDLNLDKKKDKESRFLTRMEIKKEELREQKMKNH